MTFGSTLSYWNKLRPHEAARGMSREKLPEERERELCSFVHRGFFQSCIGALRNNAAAPGSSPFGDAPWPTTPVQIEAALTDELRTLITGVDQRRPGFRAMALLHLTALWLAARASRFSTSSEFDSGDLDQAVSFLAELRQASAGSLSIPFACCTEGIGRALLLDLARDIFIAVSGNPAMASHTDDTTKIGTLLVGDKNEGVAAELVLILTQSPGERHLYPAPAFALVKFRTDFLDALRSAKHVAVLAGWPADCSVQWRLDFRFNGGSTSNLDDALEGPSLGGAFAVGLADLLHRAAQR